MTRRGRPDPYYQRAKREGYAARAVYKLAEMDRRYRLMRRGQRVLDLGCHPGSWLQYAAERVGPSGLVVGVDRRPPTVALPPWVRFREADLMSLSAAELREFAPAFDLVLSDAAPATTGVRAADAEASLALAGAALDLALALLPPGGSFLAKVYQGPGMDDLVRRVKGSFEMGKGHKPPASRSQSREMYLLGRRRRPEAR